MTHKTENFHEDDDDNYDADRYDSIADWQPPYAHQKLLDEYRKKNPEVFPADNLLDVRPAGEWLTDANYDPPATQLFGDLWKEGELAILFGDTATGKSVLATQIAESIACGRAFAEHSPFTTHHSPLRVLYLDFELTSAQFLERYSVSRLSTLDSPLIHYAFSPNFLRSEIKWNDALPRAFKTLTQFMTHSLIARLNETESRVLIVDNISYLNNANTNANSALTLMRALNTLKKELGISILVLAHTPKRPIRKAITVNDLAGSKILANFADNMFAIGTSTQDKNLRYIKEIKVRNHPSNYDESNVIICRLEKMASPFVSSPHVSKGSTPHPEHRIPHSETPHPELRTPHSETPHSELRTPHSSAPFLGFAFLEFDTERHHTIRPHETTFADRPKLIAAARALSQKGHTHRDIAEILNLGKGTVGRYLSESNDS